MPTVPPSEPRKDRLGADRRRRRDLRQAEVTNLHLRLIPPGQENVGWLDIAVLDAFGVRRG